jgi:nitric oxide dioxygenase
MASQAVSALQYIIFNGLSKPLLERYSLSDSYSPDHFRISVKRDPGIRATFLDSEEVDTTSMAHPGWMSNLLHDTLHEGDDINISSPFGDFFLDEKSRGPVVFLAAGVGVTPLLSMLNTLTSDTASSTRSISWVQGARSRAHHAFESHVRSVGAAHPQTLSTAYFYSQLIDAADGGESSFKGRIDLTAVKSMLHLQNPEAQYYICGPDAFMGDMMRALKGMDVDTVRIHAEVFSGGALPN